LKKQYQLLVACYVFGRLVAAVPVRHVSDILSSAGRCTANAPICGWDGLVGQSIISVAANHTRSPVFLGQLA
jgi:hypothetical protein